MAYDRGFLGGTCGKEPACQCERHRFDPWVGKIPWRRAWQPTPVFLPVDRGACWATVHRIAKSRTQLKWLSMHAWLMINKPILLNLKYNFMRNCRKLRYNDGSSIKCIAWVTKEKKMLQFINYWRFSYSSVSPEQLIQSWRGRHNI